jgi:protein TonB
MSRAWGVLLALAVHAVLLFGVRGPTRSARLVRHESTVEVALVAGAREEASPQPVAPAEPPPVPEPPPPPPEPAPPPAPPVVREKPESAPRRAEPPTPSESPAASEAGATTVESAPGQPASAPQPSMAARPRYKTNPEPAYPVSARRRRQEGSVLLRVHVSAAGRPEAVSIRRSSGFEVLDEAAVEAVRRWEFEPALVDGRPVASEVEIPIRFELE